MTVLNRVTNILQANINALLDKAENPEAMVRQLIREMEENIIELRKETARALSSKKLLEKKRSQIEARQQQLQARAEEALKNGDEATARNFLTQKNVLEEEKAEIAAQLSQLEAIAEGLQKNRLALEDKVQQVRRQKEEIIRRNIVQGNLPPVPTSVIERANQVLQSGDAHIADIEKQKDKLLQMELENEAMDELMNSDETATDNPQNTEKLADPKSKAAEQLAKLKAKLKNSGDSK
jgi:phage shock protein A